MKIPATTCIVYKRYKQVFWPGYCRRLCCRIRDLTVECVRFVRLKYTDDCMLW